MSIEAGATGAPQPDRVSQIIDYLNDPTLDELPESLRFKYEDGFDPDRLEEELQEHPFFMTELPDPSKPLPPLLEAFQQLKYSETDNTPHELACNHKEDGMYHFKIKKYRIASTCFTNAISHEMRESSPDNVFLAQVYNNRSACMYFIKNYRSCARDCRSALEHLPGYFKAFKRCVLALIELERWDEVEQMCAQWEKDHRWGSSGEPRTDASRDQEAFVCESRMKARKGSARARTSERVKQVQLKEKQKLNDMVMGMIKERGIQCKDDAFLVSEAANNGRVVAIENDTELAWPVLFMYPQYSQSDLIEAFSENQSFSAHLGEMLAEDNGPAWDQDREYLPHNVDLYYLNNKLVRVDPEDTLLSVMQDSRFVVPGNGVPCFFVLAKGNKFCEDFIERVDVA